MMREFRINAAMRAAAVCLLACLLVFPASASAAHRVRLGVGFGFGRFYSPYWGYWPGYYWSPYYGYYEGYYPEANMGKVKIENAEKTDRVYLDGAYAGVVGDLKTMHLRAGTYNLEVRNGDNPVLSQRLYVVAGKTVKVVVNDGNRPGGARNFSGR